MGCGTEKAKLEKATISQNPDSPIKEAVTRVCWHLADSFAREFLQRRRFERRHYATVIG